MIEEMCIHLFQKCSSLWLEHELIFLGNDGCSSCMFDFFNKKQKSGFDQCYTMGTMMI